MSRTFIKSVLIAAVTVTGISLATASPAKAGNDDLAKFLFGATALIIIGKAISDSDAKAAPVYRPKPKPLPHFSKALPRKCLRRHETWDGRVRLMSERCLQRHYRFTDRLPDRCYKKVRTYEGPRRGYNMRCLRDRGFFIASR